MVKLQSNYVWRELFVGHIGEVAAMAEWYYKNPDRIDSQGIYQLESALHKMAIAYGYISNGLFADAKDIMEEIIW